MIKYWITIFIFLMIILTTVISLAIVQTVLSDVKIERFIDEKS